MAWYIAARSSDLEEGSVLGVRINEFKIAIYRIEGKVYATSDVCTHSYALLSEGYLDGDCIECPLHQALFHVPSGDVRSPPACESISTYRTKESAGDISVELPS